MEQSSVPETAFRFCTCNTLRRAGAVTRFGRSAARARALTPARQRARGGLPFLHVEHASACRTGTRAGGPAVRRGAGLVGACKALPGLRAGDPSLRARQPASEGVSGQGRTASWPGPGLRRPLEASPACRPSTPLHSTPHEAGTVASCCGGATRGSLSRASHPRRPSAFRKLSVPRCASAICLHSTSPMPEPSGFVV